MKRETRLPPPPSRAATAPRRSALRSPRAPRCRRALPASSARLWAGPALDAAALQDQLLALRASVPAVPKKARAE